MAKHPNSSSYINSKRSQENQLNQKARKTTSDHSYPSQPKHWSSTIESRSGMINAIQRFASGQSSTKLGSQKENAYTGGHPNISHSSARNIHTPASPKTSLLKGTENKSNTNAPSIVRNLQTSLPLLVLGSGGEDGRIGASIGVIG